MLFIYGGLVVALAGSWIIVQFVFRRVQLSWVVFGNVPRSLAPAVKVKPEYTAGVMQVQAGVDEKQGF
ncbi:hypothetical protein D3C75_1336880 [compost metagenome]